jgi:RNA polymerase sigma factor (sigma-70 family)
MSATQAAIVLRHLRGVAFAEPHPDRQLLERFVRGREEAAFAALVKRHGPLVLGVCRRVLRDGHDAEDAFQATFLALARNAGSVGVTGSLAGWLYRVAYHTALRSRTRAASRLRHERQVEAPPRADPLAEVTGRELLAVLDEELQRLAECHRLPLVLCYLEGRTCDEASRQLGWALRTFKRRLDEARSRLRRRLERRGLGPPAALLGTGMVATAVPPTLAASTVRAATAGIVGITAGKLKPALAVGLAVVLTAGAVGWYGFAAPAAEGPPAAAASKGPPAADEKKSRSVAGLVLNAEGKPIAGAAVVVQGWPRRPPRAADPETRMEVLGRGKTDAGGTFRIEIPRTSSVDHWSLAVLAGAVGHGLAVQEWSPDAERPEAVLRLEREQVIRGRLVDLQGAAAANVAVRVESVRRKGQNNTYAPLGDLAPWPAAVTTGPDGRFTLRGLGATCDVHLAIADERFASGRL